VSDTTIDLLRHGEPVGGRRYRGHIDDPLSERGWQQMWSAVENPGSWEQIISSPLIRCSAFARALAEKLDLPYHEDKRLMEVRFGDWEGLTGDQLRLRDPQILARFYHDPVRQRPKDAERLEDFQRRVSAVFEDIQRTYEGRRVLVVTHAGVIRAVIAHVVQAPVSALYRISVPTASLARVHSNAERPPTLTFCGRRSL
jgi:alpha-ribazole phosphatase/probable phosphoglycerate mutase